MEKFYENLIKIICLYKFVFHIFDLIAVILCIVPIFFRQNELKMIAKIEIYLRVVQFLKIG